MAIDFEIKQGDLRPTIEADFTDADGEPLSLTGLTVRFRMRLSTETELAIDAAATVTDPAEGAVKYTWQAGDTDTPGLYYAEWVVMQGATELQRVPGNRSFHQIVIFPNLG